MMMISQILVFFGCYSTPDQHEIFCYQLNPETGELKLLQSADFPNASYLAIAPDGKRLYAVSEVGKYKGKPSGAVASFDITASGIIKTSEQATKAKGPCHLMLSGDGQTVVVANYSGGATTVLPVNEDGTLGKPRQVLKYKGSSAHPRRQTQPHAHSVFFDASGQFAYVQDLGTDLVMQYRLVKGKLKSLKPASVKTKPGAGPRHLAIHKDLSMAYLINELDNTITRLSVDAESGQLTAHESYPTLPESFSGNSTTADIHVSPDGRFLYGSNRGHDSLVIYAIDQTSGTLSLVGHEKTGGKTPRSFAISPDGGYILVAHQDSDLVTSFRVDQQTGKLTRLPHDLELPKPVCVRFLQLN